MHERTGHGAAKSSDRTSAARSVETSIAASQTSAIPGSAAHLLHLQRTVGNAAVARAIDVARDGRRTPDEDVQRSAVQGVLRSPGKPLDAPVRADMETRLGADFSDVRLHTGSTAQRSAAEIGARAYTSGNHIVVGSGGVDKHTLAHELTHVVQQRSGPVAGTDNGNGLKVSDPSDRFEREAERNATQVMRSATTTSRGQRAPDLPARTHGSWESVQRAVENATYEKGADSNAAELFFKNCDEMVKKAYEHVVQVPHLGPRSETDRHTKKWTDLWREFLEYGSTSDLYMAFGYAIESLVSKDDEFKPSVPGYELLFQVAMEGTRPDIVLMRGSEQVAWLDITSSKSAGHIFGKLNWVKKIGAFAESTYPALDAPTLILMRGNKDNSGSLSAEEFQDRKEAAEQKSAERRDYWKGLRKNFQKSSKKAELERAGLSGGLAGLGDNQTKVQEFIQSELKKHFGVSPEIQNVPSVLHAMGVDLKAWGFVTVTRDKGIGERWLMENDPDAIL